MSERQTDIHTCHEGCPCRHGGTPAPDFVRVPVSALEKVMIYEALTASANEKLARLKENIERRRSEKRGRGDE
jgi:hypothetical protein